MADKYLLQKICSMHYVDNLTQQVIGDRLGISRVKVSRLLDEARREGFVEFKLNFNSSELSELESEIERKFSIRECSIVPTFENTEEIIREMADSLSNILDRYLKDNTIIGISWGTTLEGMARNIGTNKKRKKLTIVPIVGAVGLEGSGSYTNYVTRSFAEKLGGINYTINVPAVVNSEQEKNIMEKISNTDKIIELARKASIILVGMSNLSTGSSLGKTGNISKDEIDYLNSLGVTGNVNLLFINSKGEYVKNKVEKRIVRILDSDEMLEKDVKIGIAFGDSKSKVIASALEGGWINVLITDENTAKSVLSRE